MKGFTIIPNNILTECQLSIPARYLYCVLLRYCGKNEWCFPSQKTLANDLCCTDRYIRDLIKELIKSDLVHKQREGYNRSNRYKLAKVLTSHRNSSSYQLGSAIPLHEGTVNPPKNTYLKGKDNNGFNYKGLEKMRQALIKLKTMEDRKLTVSSI